MPVLPPADVAAAPVGLAAGIAYIILVPIVIVEAIVLRLMRWAGTLRSFIAALAMNVASALIGVVILNVAALVRPGDAGRVLLIVLIPSLVLSIVIEGIVMWRLQRRSIGRTLGVAAVANAASYIMLAAFVLFLGAG